MLFDTGDTHGDFTRFTTANFPEQKEMTKDDYVLIDGDFGGIWATSELVTRKFNSNSYCEELDGEPKSEKYWLDWLENKPFTTLFIDGNHENYDRLDKYPIKEFHGGKVHEIRPHVLHLMRGQVFTLEEKTFFTFGGASSHDIRDGILEPDDPRISRWSRDYTKLFRVNHESWWERELPTQEEMDEGMRNLEAHDFKVDYIITHSPYTSILRQMDGGSGLYQADYLSDYLQEIKCRTEFHQWIFGHIHVNQMFYWDRSCCIYEQISRLL